MREEKQPTAGVIKRSRVLTHGTPVDEGERQKCDGDDGLSVQDDKGKAEQACHVGEQQVRAEGQCIIHDRRVAAEPVQQPPCMTIQ